MVAPAEPVPARGGLRPISLLRLSQIPKICGLKLSGELSMGQGIPPLELKILLESKPSEIKKLSTEMGRTPS